MSIDSGMTSAKLEEARVHVQNVCIQGQTIELIKPTAKDEFGEITTESILTLKAFPVRFTPYDRKTQDKISWSEETDILCYVSKKVVDDMNIRTDIIRQTMKLRHNKKTYDIRYVEPYSAFADDYLYYVIGGKK
jgi:hypothetical protein